MAFDFTSDYDENLTENPFFQLLQKKFNDLFLNAVAENCVICVPKSGSCPSDFLTLEDFLTHILVPTDELPESHYSNLCGARVEINNGMIIFGCEVGRRKCVRILFQETFYTEDGLKYFVLCIEQPLNEGAALETNNKNAVVLKNSKDCLDFLWTESGTHETIERIDREVMEFLQKFDIASTTDLEAVRDSVNPLYVKCLKILLKNFNIRKKYKVQKHSFNNLKIAVNTYLQQGVYTKVIRAIKLCTASEDSKLNKIIQNCSDLHFKDFKINSKLYSNIPKARLELSKISTHNTCLGKLGCLKQTIISLSEFDNDRVLLNADDLLQVLSFLIIKTNLPDWNAQLKFLKLFYLSNHSVFDENCYLIVSLEAAIAYIQNSFFSKLGSHESQTRSYCEGNLKNCQVDLLKQSNETASLKEKTICQFFREVAHGNLEEVMKIVEKGLSNVRDYSSLDLCHPLCLCDKCADLLRSECDVSLAINSCDDLGMTALHIASIYNAPNLVEYLLTHGAGSNASDHEGRTPAHHAALRGHQTVLLLLLHNDANANALDNSLNTPLHLCSNNGHENCVKAIIYFSEYSGSKLNLNQQNVRGDTPLHHASKWGYQNIVEILLESGSDPTILNRKKSSPIDYSHNENILKLLNQNCPKIKIKSREPVLEEESVLQVSSSSSGKNDNRIHKGIQPSSTDSMRKVEKVLRAVENGDLNLVFFYMGIETNGGPPDSVRGKCHPLCSCVRCKDASRPDGKEARKTGMNLDVCDANGRTPLHVASKQGNAEMVRGLVKSGASLSVRTWPELWTPLMVASRHERVEAVEELLRAGSEIDLQDCQADTALHHACRTGNGRLVQVILGHGPRIDLRNSAGKTAFQEAKEKLFIGIMQSIKGKPILDFIDF